MQFTRWGLLSLSLLLSDIVSAKDLVYVKKESREATREASLSASGQAAFPSKWYLIGPFDNGDFNTAHPPEKEIDLEAEYAGIGQKATWRAFDFPDGHIHNLKRFEKSDNLACYLYRKIESPVATKIRVSLGSDDQIALWLNGKQVFSNPAIRGTQPDQDFAVLELKEGSNDLLLKIGNEGGDWSFYFQPTVSTKLQVKLDRLLDRDFPPGGEARHYRIETLPLPDNELVEGGGLAFRPDGKLFLGTRRGDVWLVHNPLSEDPDEVRLTPYARGLHEVLGLQLVGEDLYLTQRPEVSILRDNDGDDEADEFVTFADKFGLSGDYHEYIFGPARDKEGNFFVTLNVGFGGGHQAKVPYRGFCLKIDPEGKISPYAYGLRSPNGINFSPEGRLFYTDNQGEWVAACKMHEIREDEFYGHMASVRWWKDLKDGDKPKMTPPCIWFPYSLSQSVTEPIWDTTEGKFGPFEGQCFVGELTSSLIMRVALEEVNGKTQGAVFPFRRGFSCGVNRLAYAPDGSLMVAETNRGWGSLGGRPHGLERVVYTGVLPFEIHSMQITQEGWNLKFTKPVDRKVAENLANYFLESYTYHHWGTYGSPEIDREENPVSAITVSDDGLMVQLKVPKRTPGRVFHLQLRNYVAEDKSDLLHADGYYTANEFPAP